MPSLRTRLACSVLLALLALPAGAQEGAATNERLLQFAANNDEFDKAVEARAKELAPEHFPECTKIQQAVRQLPTAYGALVFPETSELRYPVPTEGLWVEHVRVRACDKVTQINMLAIARNDDNPLMFTLLPGETKSDPATQRDAERVGATTVTKANAGTCSDTPRARNTRLIGYKQAGEGVGAGDVGLGWFEDWSYRFCQEDISVQMAFIPNEIGTYDVRARLTNAVVPQAPVTKPTTPIADPTTPVTE